MKDKMKFYVKTIKKGAGLIKNKGVSYCAKRALTFAIRGEIADKVKNLSVKEVKSGEQNNWMDNADSEKVWAFCAGQYSNDFRGNPKYLFIYINKYRPDITAYWLCDSIDIIEQVRSMGYKAYQLGTREAEMVMNVTGVLVSEQVKAVIPKGLRHAKYLNLWHGVGGVKAVERSLTEGVLAYELAKKYITNNEYYINNELYLAPSSFIEDIAIKQLGIKPQNIIRACYPRNIYQKKYERISTFDFNPIKERNLPEDTRMVAYIPTYRNHLNGELFSQAIPDMSKMIEVCEENHLLMIFKMHPLIEKELSFVAAKEAFQDCPWLYFWDNQNDFYEVMDQMDLCIMDFSSMFTDFIASGVKHYLRYIFDIDPETLDFPLGYDEVTLGRKCTSYDELLSALENYTDDNLEEDIQRISRLYWEFDCENNMDVIIDDTVQKTIHEEKLPTLYSFDIFDTLISRKGLAPESIFYYVKEKMERSTSIYSKYLINNYPEIRKNCELNCREYYNRSKVERDDDRCEIQYVHIFKRMQALYDLSDEQISELMDWELEAELNDTIPLSKQIDYVKTLLERKETVILVSDMYLPKQFIRKMLEKCDPILAELPLFLSSEYGYQKSDRSLFLEVYKSFKPYYRFGRWIHYGDHPRSDGSLPESLGINSCKIERPEFNELEKELLKKINTYDAYLVAAKMARFREEHCYSKEEFVYSYVSLLFVPYVYWAIHDAVSRGDEIVYFVSRDGHHLKRIADVIIEAENIPLKTKYIYASRRIWRIPSFIDHIDVGFWGQGYGNFGAIASYEKLLKALNMNETEFRDVFPELATINEKTEFSKQLVLKLVDIFKSSQKYEAFLLTKAEKERVSACGYLKQEIDANKQFSIIEYWGRGYTQENFTRLWQQVVGEDVHSVFYYSRSTLPSDKYNIRRNFTSNPNAQQFIEAIFANISYRSIENYNYIDGQWIPEIKPLECDSKLFECMNKYLPLFAKDYCEIVAHDKIELGQGLIDFAISYYWNNQDAPLFVENLAPLVDSVELYGNKKEYARELTEIEMELISQKIPRNQISKSIVMSFARSKELIKHAYMERFQLHLGEDTRYGTWLTEEEIEKNRIFKEKKETFLEACEKKNILYQQLCADIKVQNVVLCLYSDKEISHSAFRKIYEKTRAENEFELFAINPKEYEENTEEFLRELARAKFILLEKPFPIMAGIKIRRESKVVLLGENACYFQPVRLAKKCKLREKNELKMAKEQIQFSALQTASEETKKIMRKSYSCDIETDFSLVGCCATDCYFDEEYKEEMMQLLHEAFPESIGKKIICYAPQHRYRSKDAKYSEMLDLEMLKKELGDEYVVLVNLQKGKKVNKINVKDFSKNMTKVMPLRGQMAIADVIIGDYRNVIFEAVLTGKPLMLTSWDYATTNFRKKSLFRFEDLACEISVSGTKDVIDKIKHLNDYKFDAYNKFRFKYLTYCDGKSSERLYQYLLENK